MQCGFYRRGFMKEKGLVRGAYMCDIYSTVPILNLLTHSMERVLLEKLTGLQLVKKFPTFCGA
jgi:hypothetical protein